MVRFISYSRLLTDWNLNQPTSYRYKCAYFSEWSVSGNRKYVRYLHVHVASFLIWLAFFAHIERFGVASNWITNGFRGQIVLYNLPLLLLENVCLIGIEKKQIGGQNSEMISYQERVVIQKMMGFVRTLSAQEREKQLYFGSELLCWITANLSHK